MTMPTYTVSPLEPPISPSQLTAYKTLRLASLQIDPQAFASTYTRELTLSEDAWRERLDSSSKRTFVASVLGDDSHGDTDTEVIQERGEWIGLVTIVGPSDRMASLVTTPFKEAGVGANWEIYGLYAMWVHPAHRGKGVGTELVRACLDWARTNDDTKSLGESGATSGDVAKVVVLLVYENNVVGHAFYSRAGFTDLAEVPAEEGQKWMLAKV